MKSDQLLSAIINFTIPIIFLSGMFILASFFESGFSAIIYSAIFFISGLMIFLVRFSGEKVSAAINFEYVYFFLLLLVIFYLFGVMAMVTNLFSL